MKGSSQKLSTGDKRPEMQRLTDMNEWSVGVKKFGGTKLLLENVDRMVYATNDNRSIIYGNWSLDAKFGWLYAIPMRWDTRWRKFKEL
jgi:hypothetical protein